ncbi:MAG TPA: signal peptidase I [Verrucomicrobiales bacterium]|nr:signal peptidase I [Verrucomicrobiales bacterium]
MEALLALGAGLVIIAVPIAVLIIGIWKVFTKAGKPGWAAIVPIYSIMVMAEIAGKPNWWGLLCLIPFVGLIFTIMIMHGVAEKFGKGIGMTILMIFGIGWLILGFGSAQYQGGGVAQPNYAPQP